MEYPMRLNKYLAHRNIASRREADELIRAGKVKINGKMAVLGDKINESDEVEVDTKASKKLAYFAYNKPVGVITHSPQEGEKSISDITKFPTAVYPIGRLDKDSWGLIILTNDGRITGKLLSPEKNHEKEYAVIVDKAVTQSFLGKLERGVRLDDGYRTKPAKVDQINDFMFSIILTEGKKRQIRRMCSALGYAVKDLKRVRIMNIRIKKLKPGEFRPIEGRELEELLRALGI